MFYKVHTPSLYKGLRILNLFLKGAFQGLCIPLQLYSSRGGLHSPLLISVFHCYASIVGSPEDFHFTPQAAACLFRQRLIIQAFPVLDSVLLRAVCFLTQGQLCVLDKGSPQPSGNPDSSSLTVYSDAVQVYSLNLT